MQIQGIAEPHDMATAEVGRSPRVEVRQSNETIAWSVAAIFRPTDSCRFWPKSRLPKKKVSPNLGSGLGNRDGTV